MFISLSPSLSCPGGAACCDYKTYCRGLNNYPYHFEVCVVEPSGTIDYSCIYMQCTWILYLCICIYIYIHEDPKIGIWDHDIGNYSGPCSTQPPPFLEFRPHVSAKLRPGSSTSRAHGARYILQCRLPFLPRISKISVLYYITWYMYWARYFRITKITFSPPPSGTYDEVMRVGRVGSPSVGDPKLGLSGFHCSFWLGCLAEGPPNKTLQNATNISWAVE